MKKLVILIITLILIFFIFIYNLVIPKSYTYKYKVNKYDIVEKYDKKSKVYSFKVSKKKNAFKYAISHKYSSKRGLIKKIKGSRKCISVNHDILENISICHKDNEYTTKYYNKKVNNKQKASYLSIKIYDLKDHKYYIWNYTDFIVIDGKKNTNIELFDRDLYELDIIHQIDNHLIIADYNSKYQFARFYVINMKNNKYDKVEVNRKLHMTSYILGDYKKNLYIYDPEQEKEFKFNPFDGVIDDYPYEVLVNNKWEKTTINKLNKKKVSFKNDELFSYIIKDDKLYYKMPNNNILVTKLNVSNIVKQDGKECYFIAGDTLYYVHFDEGITKVLQYSEWKFNNQNIYLF